MKAFNIYSIEGVKCEMERSKLPQKFNEFDLIIFRPRLFRVNLNKWFSVKDFILFILTSGKYEILYLVDGRSIVHYSYLIQKNYRFPFMKREDIEIGPCFTNINYRGRGIYTGMLKLIIEIYSSQFKTLWIYTLSSNHISQRAIERAGFQKCKYSLKPKGMLNRLITKKECVK